MKHCTSVSELSSLHFISTCEKEGAGQTCSQTETEGGEIALSGGKLFMGGGRYTKILKSM